MPPKYDYKFRIKLIPNITGRSKGDARDACPLWVQFLSFSCSFRETFGQMIGWRSHLRVGAPAGKILDPPLNMTMYCIAKSILDQQNMFETFDNKVYMNLNEMQEKVYMHSVAGGLLPWPRSSGTKFLPLPFQFFQNEGIFVQLDELDELDKITHVWTRIHLQSHPSTENSLV